MIQSVGYKLGAGTFRRNRVDEGKAIEVTDLTGGQVLAYGFIARPRCARQIDCSVEMPIADRGSRFTRAPTRRSWTARGAEIGGQVAASMPPMATLAIGLARTMRPMRSSPRTGSGCSLVGRGEDRTDADVIRRQLGARAAPDLRYG